MKKTVGKALFLMSAAVLTGCANKAAAPVVYGSQPAWQGRIYTDPAQTAAERERLATVRQRSTPDAVGSTGRPEPVLVTPLQTASVETRFEPAIGANDEIEELAPPQRFDYNARPIYLAERRRGGDAAKVERSAVPSSALRPIKTAATSSRVGNLRDVIVRRGDTVYAIARRFGAAPADIIDVNRLRAPYTLEIGQVLRVPAVGARQTAANTSRKTRRTYLTHVVSKGDTLYSISRSTGVGVKELARANKLRAPYELSIGDKLRVPAREGIAIATSSPKAGDRLTPVSYSTPKSTSGSGAFGWPVKGAVLARYGVSNGERNDGLNIAAPIGTPVRAAADGEVVYRGSELDDFGNLLLIRHDDGFVTAYAHTEAMIVRKGQKVRRGQVIAKVGQTGSASEPQLHFEIRQNLKAIDPLVFLGN